MSLVFSINNIEIFPSDVIEYPKSQEVITQGQTSNLFPSDLTLILDNTSGDYDDRLTTSLFFGSGWYNSELTIYDNIKNVYIWQGKVKSLTLSENDKTVSVYSTNLIQDIASTVLSYSSTSNTTPSEHIYTILTDVVGFSDDDIDLSGFNEAINIQEDNSVYVNMSYSLEDNKNCLPVISELCRMTQCDLYTENNKIKIRQWQEYSGVLGTLIENKNLIAGAYKHYFDDSVIYNSYSVLYDNGGNIAISTGSNTTSQSIYGVRQFIVPNETIDSTTSTDFKILFKSSVAAEWSGDLAITRYQAFLKYFEISTGDELTDINLNTLVDLSFDGMSREPGRIISKNANTDTGTIDFKGYFVNTPYEYVSRDTTPPAVPTIITAIGTPGGQMLIKYTQNSETDFIGYYVFFTTTSGEWDVDVSNLGQSPADVKNPNTTPDGYNYTILSDLNNGSTYSVKIKSYDNLYNLSEFSNIMTATMYQNADNTYMLSGDPWSGLTLDNSNPLSGTAITGLSAYYDVSKFDQVVFSYAALYETTFYKKDNLSNIKFKGYSESGSIYYQYTQSNDGSTFDTWSSISTASGTINQILTKKYVKIRFLLDPVLWTDSDNIYIVEVN